MNSRTQKKKHGYKYKREYYLKAIVIEPTSHEVMGYGPYHNIRDVDHQVNRFMRNMKLQFPGATHVNFYNSITGKFLYQKRYELPKQTTKQTERRHQVNRYFGNLTAITGESWYHTAVILQQWDI